MSLLFKTKPYQVLIPHILRSSRTQIKGAKCNAMQNKGFMSSIHCFSNDKIFFHSSFSHSIVLVSFFNHYNSFCRILAEQKLSIYSHALSINSSYHKNNFLKYFYIVVYSDLTFDKLAERT